MKGPPLSHREKIIAAVTLAALVGYGGYAWALAPYLASRAQLTADIKGAQRQLDAETNLLDNRGKVDADWKSLLDARLSTTAAPAISNTQNFLYDAAEAARFHVENVKPERATREKDFQTIRLQVAGFGSTASLFRLLAAIEKSDLPLKIDECRINSRKEGTDDLNVTLTVTTLIFSPPPTSRPALTPAQPTGASI